jgi:hypothetical protein
VYPREYFFGSLKKIMNKALIHETPAKVFSLLGTALFSLAFMFGVSVSNASFSKMEVPLADPFSPEKVVSVIDQAASSYSNFLAVNFISPLASDYKIYADNLAWIAKEGRFAYYLGIEGFSGSKAKVAGAYTSFKPQLAQNSSKSISDVFSVLIR